MSEDIQRVSGVTAISAAILALIVAAYSGVGVILSFMATAFLNDALGEGVAPHWMVPSFAIAGIAGAVAALVLVIGAFMLFVHKLAGRMFVVFGCVVAIVVAIAPHVLGYFWPGPLASAVASQTGESPRFGFGPLILVSIGIPLLTIILASLPSTRRWCGRVA